jgi:hypothetical protein
MHDCLFGCGQACACDMEDHWQETPDDCCHECDEESEDDFEDWLDGAEDVPYRLGLNPSEGKP